MKGIMQDARRGIKDEILNLAIAESKLNKEGFISTLEEIIHVCDEFIDILEKEV